MPTEEETDKIIFLGRICKVSETFSLGTLCAKVTMHSYGELEEFAAEKLVKVNFPPPGFIDAANFSDLREFICCQPESFSNLKKGDNFVIKTPKTKQDALLYKVTCINT